MNATVNDGQTILKTNGIVKRFPGVTALAGIDFDLKKGEVHCIVGENGAGKSTFIKVLSGALRPDEGEIYLGGQRFSFLDPHSAQSLGIQVIYQENILVPQISVAENVFVGREKTGRFGLIDYRTIIDETRRLAESLGIDLDPEELVGNLPTADQQFVKILKALARESRVLIMDEPTTMFNRRNIEAVLNLVKDISRRGIGVIYISHNLKEVVRIADRITVLRDGRTVSSYCNSGGVDINRITSDMVGHSVNLFYQKEESKPGEIILEVKDLQLTQESSPISFVLRKGEILGIAGMVGSGRTEIVRAIFGAHRKWGGRLIFRGEEVEIQSPEDAVSVGWGFLTEDRQKSGLALKLGVGHNTTVAGLNRFRGLFMNLQKESNWVQELVEKLSIKTPSLNQEVRFLSGGNQQKVVLARWLFKESEILILDEPTRGIDVNSKAEIYRLMSRLAQSGKSIILVSSDLQEIISMSDRVLVIRDGRIAAELSGTQISEETIISYAIGVDTYEHRN